MTDTEIAALVEHLSDVRRLLRGEGRNTSASYVTKAAAAILALQQRVRELEGDARRYQFIRSGEYSPDDEKTWLDLTGALHMGEYLDAAVDRTMRGES